MLSYGKIYLPIYDDLIISWNDDSATKYAYTGFSLFPCDLSTYSKLLTKICFYSLDYAIFCFRCTCSI